MQFKFTSIKKIGLSALVVVCAVAIGIATAFAATSSTTGTNVSCATATLPSHTVAVDGSGVDTISGTSTQACNTVTYTIPTVTDTTTASGGTTTDSGATSSTSTTTSTPTGAVVPASPSGVTAPSGGWKVEYGDAFGSCFTDTATKCTAGYSRQDNTLEAISQANGFGNSNEKGVLAFMPSEVDVTSAGLVQRCDTAANVPNSYGDPFTCGSTKGLNTRGFAKNPFNWNFGANRHFVIQYAWSMPDNSTHQDDPAVWETGVNWAWEIDNPECWGYGFGADSAADHGWYDKSCGLIAVPKDTGGSTGNLQVTLGTTANVPVDPTSMHTYTLDLNDNSSGTLVATAYIDGTKIGSHSYTKFSSSTGKFILANSMRLNKACGCNVGLPAGGNSETIRYVAVYEPASASNAGTNGPLVVPGTTVG